MIVPSYWAEARTTLKVKGRNMTLRRFGWSDASLEDAHAQAELRVAEAARLATAGEPVARRETKRAYNGAQGLPIREEVLARHGEAVITRNAYGARCLNVPDLLIADVDIDDKPSRRVRLTSILLAGAAAMLLIAKGGHWWTVALGVLLAFLGAGLLTRLLCRLESARAGTPQERTRQRVREFVSRHPGWRLRLYRTPAGLRLIATHARFAPSSDAVQDFFEAVGVDPIYARMCLNQNCFRARLTAKPWRIGIPDHLRPRPGVWPIRPEAMGLREAWLSRYERAAEGFAACRHEETLGTGPDDASLADWVTLHDAESRALDGARPLA